MSQVPTLFLAFVAGIASFLSPCILPLVPAFLSYISGTGAAALEARQEDYSAARRKTLANTVLFVLGFSIVFSVLGLLLNNFLAGISYDLKEWLGRVAGIVIIVFGLSLLKLVRLPWLEQERKLKVSPKRGYAGSFLFGAAFAAGWTPCVGLVLASVLALAATQPGQAFALLLAYSIGLGIPFLLAAAFAAQARGWIARNQAMAAFVEKAMGAVLVAIGALVFFGKLSQFAELFPPIVSV